ncbi:MAG: WhiB family transcriptional regulator [Acidimicrobiales bacterium]
MLVSLGRHRAALLFDAGGWRSRAACRDMGPDLFFPAGERAEDAVGQVAAAKAVCACCPVRLHCLTYALVASPEDGVWGGLALSERTALRRQRRLRTSRFDGASSPAASVTVSRAG